MAHSPVVLPLGRSNTRWGVRMHLARSFVKNDPHRGGATPRLRASGSSGLRARPPPLPAWPGQVVAPACASTYRSGTVTPSDIHFPPSWRTVPANGLRVLPPGPFGDSTQPSTAKAPGPFRVKCSTFTTCSPKTTMRGTAPDGSLASSGAEEDSNRTRSHIANPATMRRPQPIRLCCLRAQAGHRSSQCMISEPHRGHLTRLDLLLTRWRQSTATCPVSAAVPLPSSRGGERPGRSAWVRGATARAGGVGRGPASRSASGSCLSM